MELHPEILSKNGRPEFAILPYDEFVELRDLAHDAEDLKELRAAKVAEGHEPGITLSQAKDALGLSPA